MFNMCVDDIDNYRKKRRIEERRGGIKLGKKKVWVLEYADNLVLLVSIK